jgi:hypothetical protein
MRCVSEGGSSRDAADAEIRVASLERRLLAAEAEVRTRCVSLCHDAEVRESRNGVSARLLYDTFYVTFNSFCSKFLLIYVV